jgi:hypothetical protein
MIFHGRDFNTRDRKGSPAVVVVNRAFAKRFLPGVEPVGAQVAEKDFGPGARDLTYQVVGVVEDAVYRSLRSPMEPTLYMPYAQEGVSSVATRGINKAHPLPSTCPNQERSLQTVPEIYVAARPENKPKDCDVWRASTRRAATPQRRAEPPFSLRSAKKHFSTLFSPTAFLLRRLRYATSYSENFGPGSRLTQSPVSTGVLGWPKG